jgi:PIN domain nuclease of toxin-antitoxin system
MGQAQMILLDTNVVLWLTLEPSRLSSNAKSAIENARRNSEALAICDITLLEVATLASKGRIRLSVSVESFLQQVESRFVVLPITAKACAGAISLPATYPNDPADRIIGGTAMVENLPLLTADREIRHSKSVQTIW